MTIEVEIVGGPRDGDIIAIGDTQRIIKFPKETPLRAVNMRPEDERALVLQAFEVDIVLTPNGYRLYWNEGRPC